MQLNMRLWSLLTVSALLFAGCSGTATRGDDPGASVEERAGAGGVQTSGLEQGGLWTGSPLDNPSSLLYTKTIYFDFDQSTIRSDFHEVLRAHAAYLIGQSGATVLIEGHADERGSREYNIALGERRAQAVQRFLEAEGVNRRQINTISYGEERPVALGHDESSWAENRRGVLVY